MRLPKTNAGNRRNPISFRLTDPEFLPLQAVAERVGLKVNELCRRLAVQPKSEAMPLPGFRPDPAAVKRLDGIGQTLLRLEKAGQENQSFTPELLAELSTTLKGIHAFVEAAVLERVRE